MTPAQIKAQLSASVKAANSLLASSSTTGVQIWKLGLPGVACALGVAGGGLAGFLHFPHDAWLAVLLPLSMAFGGALALCPTLDIVGHYRSFASNRESNRKKAAQDAARVELIAETENILALEELQRKALIKHFKELEKASPKLSQAYLDRYNETSKTMKKKRLGTELSGNDGSMFGNLLEDIAQSKRPENDGSA
jgi:hypothetical protein